jgi:hypothetical protein
LTGSETKVRGTRIIFPSVLSEDIEHPETALEQFHEIATESSLRVRPAEDAKLIEDQKLRRVFLDKLGE